MMKKMLNKIKNNSGTSILLALIFVLTVLMVVSVVLSAAVTASKNIQYDETQQQAYLTASSAAIYIRDELGRGVLKMDETEGHKLFTDSVNKKTGSEYVFETDEVNIIETDGSKYPNCDFGPLLAEAVESVANSGEDQTYKFRLDFADDNLQSVYVTFLMKKNYDIAVTLELKETEDNGGREKVIYKMSIDLLVDDYLSRYGVSVVKDGKAETEWHNIRVMSWNGGTIRKENQLIQ